MRKTTYYCDVCGKEFTDNPQNFMHIIRIKERHLFSCADIKEKEIDICFDCMRELYKLLKISEEKE